jgi:hypothetical protein
MIWPTGTSTGVADGASLKPRRCTSLDLIKVSLNLAMGLTTILTTIGSVHQNPPGCEILIFKDN